MLTAEYNYDNSQLQQWKTNISDPKIIEKSIVKHATLYLGPSCIGVLM